MAFLITCDFCNGRGRFEYEEESVFVICEDCGQEREVPKEAVN